MAMAIGAVRKNEWPIWPVVLTPAQQQVVNELERKKEELKTTKRNNAAAAIDKAKNAETKMKKAEKYTQAEQELQQLTKRATEFYFEITHAVGGHASNVESNASVTFDQLKQFGADVMQRMRQEFKREQSMLQNGGDGDSLNKKLGNIEAMLRERVEVDKNAAIERAVGDLDELEVMEAAVNQVDPEEALQKAAEDLDEEKVMEAAIAKLDREKVLQAAIEAENFDEEELMAKAVEALDEDVVMQKAVEEMLEENYEEVMETAVGKLDLKAIMEKPELVAQCFENSQFVDALGVQHRNNIKKALHDAKRRRLH